ncbi:hypothetical protein H5183_14750 [Pseudoalteromonas sp. SR44-8]|uniref:hypothetical protein n=1 Tax=Pseudoalteromonas sp. SR44-8 TaxID=2760933 RepID=UPI0016031397|nr:hypothetical protein [Pseudoalteromonas sp. SR44-8]MBB1302601.1 hypothetical protein [Pseudoalteromonas sp. SR44-8]
MDYTHIGWIPCINGHLDYGLMSPGISGSFTNKKLQDPKTTKINYGFLKQYDHHARRIILQSKLDWKDSNTKGCDGRFRVIVVAETNESENLDERNLQGKLFIYPLAQEPKLTKDGESSLPWFEHIHKAKPLHKKISSKLTPAEWEGIQTDLNRHYNSVVKNLSKNFDKYIEQHFYEISFSVDPRGFTKLKLTNSLSKVAENKAYLAIRQAFYYIKYSLHSHKHHYIEEDSLTTIVPYEAESPDAVGLKLLGQLKRELTSIKRTYSSGGQKAFGEEQGIISYMNSLCASLKSARYLKPSTYNREKEYLNSLSNSFYVQSGKRDRRDKSESDIRSNYRTYVAWAFSLVSILWLVVIKGFVKYPDTTKFEVPGGLPLQLILVVVFLLCSVYLYVNLVKRKVENTLNTEGLIAWVEKNYIVEDKKFRRNQLVRIFKAVATVIATVLVIVALDYAVSH